MPQPSDFPRHTAEPLFDLYWKLTRDGDRIQADGLALSRQPDVAQATLQLIGFDVGGSVVDVTSTVVRWHGWFPERFSIQLRSEAERFELRVLRFSYPSGAGR